MLVRPRIVDLNYFLGEDRCSGESPSMFQNLFRYEIRLCHLFLFCPQKPNSKAFKINGWPFCNPGPVGAPADKRRKVLPGADLDAKLDQIPKEAPFVKLCRQHAFIRRTETKRSAFIWIAGTGHTSAGTRYKLSTRRYSDNYSGQG